MIDASESPSVDAYGAQNARQAPAAVQGGWDTALLLEGLLRCERATERVAQQVANYLAPFRFGGVKPATTTGPAYPAGAGHVDDGYAEQDSLVSPVLTRRIDVLVVGPASVVVQWDPGPGTWEGGVELPIGRHALLVSARRVRVKTADATAAQQSRYQLTLWC